MASRSPSSVLLQHVQTENEITLGAVSGGQPMLIVLLRHMDCPLCEIHVADVIRHRDEIGRVAIVGFESVEQLRSHFVTLPREFVLLADPTRDLYGALRLRRGNLWSVLLRPQIMATAARTVLRGRRIARRGSDLMQLGGDVVLRPDGTVAWSHISASADDRPSVATLLAAMRSAEPATRAAA